MTIDYHSYCSFCGKSKDLVKKLIVGDAAGICNECVDFCQHLLNDENIVTVPATTGALNPKDLKMFLDQYIIGQDLAKIMLSVAIVNHYKRIDCQNRDNLEISKANILMLGPTGSGKTLLAKTVAKYLNVPFAIADATSITEAGYVGDDVETLIARLYAAADYDIAKTERGIIFIDEIDKISRRSESTSITRDVSGEGVQQALLKLVEGTKCRVPVSSGRKHPSGDVVEIDTTNILFIAGGAFVGLDKIVQGRRQKSSIGFNASVNVQETESEILKHTSPSDIVKFGMIPEFVGRFPNWVSLQELNKADLVKILTEVKNNFIAQYIWLFEQDGVKLSFTDDALDLIAEKTLDSKTGARGLQSQIERVLIPHMFNLCNYRDSGITQLEINVQLVNTPSELEIMQ